MASDFWVVPSLEYPILDLPVLTNTLPDQWEWVHRSPRHISIPVTEPFIQAFTQSPLSDRPTHIAEALCQIVPTLMELIRSGRDHVSATTKSHDADFVTDMDLGIEMLLRLWINRFFPDHLIIGEEGPKPPISLTDTVWYLDPVDGTNNYVGTSSMVGLNIGVLKAGKPFVSCIGLPFQDTYFIGDNDSKQVSIWQNGSIKPFQYQPYTGPRKIGTEFSWERHSVQTQLITDECQAELVRLKSICQNLTQLLSGQTSAFFKVNVKLWDIVAPLCLIYWAAGNQLSMHMYFPSESDQYIQSLMIDEHPFSNSDLYINRINYVHQHTCKAGIVIVAPPDMHDLTESVLTHYVLT